MPIPSHQSSVLYPRSALLLNSYMLQNYFSKMKFWVPPSNWSHLGMRKNGWSEFTLMCLCCIRRIWLFKKILINLTWSLVGTIWGSIRQEWQKGQTMWGKIFLSIRSWLAAWPAHSCWEWVEKKRLGWFRPSGRRTTWKDCFQTRSYLLPTRVCSGSTSPTEHFLPSPNPFSLFLNSLRTPVYNIYTNLNYIIISSRL